MKSAATQMNHSAPDVSSKPPFEDSPEYVLETTNNFLLEVVFGAYRLTVTRGMERQVQALALCVYASHAGMPPVIFHAYRDKPSAYRLIIAALEISGYADLTVSFGDGTYSKRLSVLALDEHTRQLSHARLWPSKGTRDAVSMWERLRRSAGAYRQIHDPVGLLTRIASDAGTPWPDVAAELLGGDAR